MLPYFYYVSITTTNRMCDFPFPAICLQGNSEITEEGIERGRRRRQCRR